MIATTPVIKADEANMVHIMLIKISNSIISSKSMLLDQKPVTLFIMIYDTLISSNSLKKWHHHLYHKDSFQLNKQTKVIDII